MKVFVMNKKRAVSYLALIFCAVCILTIGTLQSADVWNDGGDKLLPIYSVEKGTKRFVPSPSTPRGTTPILMF